MNEMSTTQRLNNYELAMHALLDHIIEGQPIDFASLAVPRSIINRIHEALDSGALVGTLVTDEEAR